MPANFSMPSNLQADKAFFYEILRGGDNKNYLEVGISKLRYGVWDNEDPYIIKLYGFIIQAQEALSLGEIKTGEFEKLLKFFKNILEIASPDLIEKRDKALDAVEFFEKKCKKPKRVGKEEIFESKDKNSDANSRHISSAMQQILDQILRNNRQLNGKTEEESMWAEESSRDERHVGLKNSVKGYFDLLHTQEAPPYCHATTEEQQISSREEFQYKLIEFYALQHDTAERKVHLVKRIIYEVISDGYTVAPFFGGVVNPANMFSRIGGLRYGNNNLNQTDVRPRLENLMDGFLEKDCAVDIFHEEFLETEEFVETVGFVETVIKAVVSSIERVKSSQPYTSPDGAPTDYEVGWKKEKIMLAPAYPIDPTHPSPSSLLLCTPKLQAEEKTLPSGKNSNSAEGGRDIVGSSTEAASRSSTPFSPRNPILVAPILVAVQDKSTTQQQSPPSSNRR